MVLAEKQSLIAGRETKPDCWQRNEKTSAYLYSDEIIYKGIITKPEYKKYIV